MSAGSRCRLEPYLRRLYGYAVSLCREPDEARDLVQETAVRALGAAEQPRDDAAYRAWLFRILRNAFLDRNRRRRVRESFDDPSALDPGPKPGPGEYWTTDERLINTLTVRLELSRLPAKHREIIGLIDLAGLSYREAAEALGVPVGTIMSRISRARAQLIKSIDAGNLRFLDVERRRRS